MDSPKRASLAQAIKQTRPFTSLEQEAYLSILRTAFELTHKFDHIFKECAITPTQYNVLRILQGAGEEGLSRNEIGARMVTPMPDVTRLLDRMESARLVARRRSQDDRRQVSTCITHRGKEILLRLAKPVAQAHKEQFKGMRQADLQTLIDLLTEARQSV